MTTSPSINGHVDPTLVLESPILEARDIDFSYGKLQVLFGVSMHVMPGESLALLGTNGAGKSTLLRVLSGLETPSAGAMTLAGADITGQPAESLVTEGLVMIPGGKAVFPDMTVDENLEMQALTVRHDTQRVKQQRERILELLPAIGKRLDQPAGRLSGGEQQQLALAKAIILEPSVLCIDELSLGLAPVVVQGLLDVVRTINDTGVTIVLVEQSLNIAAELCTRAIFMEKGEVRFEGRPADLLERDDIARAVFLGGREDDR